MLTEPLVRAAPPIVRVIADYHSVVLKSKINEEFDTFDLLCKQQSCKCLSTALNCNVKVFSFLI